MRSVRDADAAPRRYMVCMLIDSTGSGMYLPVSLLYFHHITGLPITRVGLTLTIGALFGLAVTPYAGTLTDRFGARAVVVGCYLLRAAAFSGYALVRSQPEMLGVVMLGSCGDRSFPSAIEAFVSELAQGVKRDRLIAAQRGIRNAGLGTGGLIASAVLGIGTPLAYRSVVLGTCLSFLIAAVLIRGIAVGSSEVLRRPGQRTTETGGGYRTIFRDRAYLALTSVNLIPALGYMILTASLPVYVTQVLHGSATWSGLTYALNTAGIALLQVPMSKLVARQGWRRSRAAALGAAFLAASFALYASANLVDAQSAELTVLLVATCVFTVGELLHAANMSSLSAAAANQDLRGRYLAFFQFSWAIPAAVAPALLTALLSFSPPLAWLVLTVGTAVSAAALVRLEPRLPVVAVRQLVVQPAAEPTTEPEGAVAAS